MLEMCVVTKRLSIVVREVKNRIEPGGVETQNGAASQRDNQFKIGSAVTVPPALGLSAAYCAGNLARLHLRKPSREPYSPVG